MCPFCGSKGVDCCPREIDRLGRVVQEGDVVFGFNRCAGHNCAHCGERVECSSIAPPTARDHRLLCADCFLRLVREGER